MVSRELEEKIEDPGSPSNNVAAGHGLREGRTARGLEISVDHEEVETIESGSPVRPRSGGSPQTSSRPSNDILVSVMLCFTKHSSMYYS